MHARQLLVGGCSVTALLLTLTPLQASKPGPPPVTCQVTIDDEVNFDGGDPELPAIMSDGKGPYVNGQSGVLCNIINDGTGHDGWLWMRFGSGKSSASTRFIWYPGQGQNLDGGPGYNGLQAQGTFEVKEFAAKVNADGDTFDVLPFRAQDLDAAPRSRVRFDGDSNFTGYGVVESTSSVFVFAHADNCTWDVWFDPTAPRMDDGSLQYGERADLIIGPRRMVLNDGSSLRYFAMPFRAQVKAISGRTCYGS